MNREYRKKHPFRQIAVIKENFLIAKPKAMVFSEKN